MERLTYFKDGHWRVNFSGVQYQADFVDRLAAYEDTGLTPEAVEVQSIALAQSKPYIDAVSDEHGKITMNPIRLHELAVADQEGRVIVLPCKVGDTVFARLDSKSKCVSKCEVKKIGLGDNIGFATIVPIGAGGREYGVSLRGFGKTVFLTREEDEKVLTGLEGKKDG